MFAILKQRNYGLLFSGRIVTNIGDSIYFIAAMWLVYDLSGSAFYSGLAGFLTQIPNVLQFLIGPLVDRWPIRATLLWTQALQAVLILIIPIAAWMDFLSVTLVLVIMPILTSIDAFAYPTETKALPLVLKKEELPAGNALFSLAYQGVDLIFNAIAGVMIAIFGATLLFIIDSLTFCIAFLLFSFLRIPHQKAQTETSSSARTALHSYFTDLKEGLSILFSTIMAATLMGAVLCNVAIGAAMAVMPAFADHRQGAAVYGLYLAAMSCGALIGALLATSFSKLPIGKATIFTVLLGSASWAVAAFVPWTWLSILLFGLSWVPIGCINVTFATLIQTLLPASLIGRVTSASASFSTIAMPIGSLAGGYAATLMPVTWVFCAAGIGVSLLSITWLLHPKLRSLGPVASLSPETLGFKDYSQQETS
ncbi:MFS transporter [Terribacillus saccharophilus]|uniref:MFS transporter n=1 Tax=Terribacillus saccharophilus TaxID=361277 RepID=A0ABX4GVH7_9BACI|nr:MFS transporter [Terribacillus saccharophilus]PAD34537.1 MFS transporter [Terribacillus saccharophilus]PAD95204.1 MFS transporter [Terribacillus saccharophilus]PAD98865.1 MFS transporter [Terribacillus saccharophilus]